MMNASREQLDRVEGIASEIIRVAVARVVASSLFEKHARQSRLLRFLVDETIEGRGEQLSIDLAMAELYREFDPTVAERILRSDLVRLADLLESYFDDEGRGDALIFAVDPKRFKLELGFHEQSPQRSGRPRQTIWNRHWALLAALGIFAVTAAATWIEPWGDSTPTVTTDKKAYRAVGSVTEAQAPMAELLPDALQLAEPTGAELDRIGRDHMFSFMNVERQKRVIAHSQAVIAKYPDYYGAYATAAHSLSSLAVLMRGSGKSRAFLESAQEMLEQAQGLAPEDPWTLSAAGWVAYAAQDWDRARELSARAYELSETDNQIIAFHALTLLFTGNFEAAERVAAPQENVSGSGDVGLYGFAKFHLQDYQAAVEAFELAMSQGIEPTPVGAAHLAAAYKAVGRDDDAARVVSVIESRWPAFRPRHVYQVFAPAIKEAHGQTFVTLLCAAGWRLAK